MPNLIDSTGLQTATKAELVANFTAAMQAIYGADINLDPDSPDGQMMNIFIQSVLDLEDLLTQIYNMFDPDNAIGVTLDERVAINGIQRQAGTFTVTNVTLVISQALSLQGLDQTVTPPYTVSDNSGSQWQLITSVNVPGPGTYVYPFQSATPGANLTVPNTITSPVTIVLGVTSINNPTTYSTLGINEETDAALKIRRQKSVSLSSQGYLSGLLAALENINGLTSVFVYENNTGSTDVNGVPGHSIWVIVSGTAAAADIANAIYTKRNAGCGMFGATTYLITQADSSLFQISWDSVVPQDLFIKFTATSLDGVNAPNLALIRSQLPILYIPGVAEEVNINGLATVVQSIDPNCLVTSAGFSTTSGGVYTNTLTPTSKKFQFVVSSPNIIITPMILSPATATVGVLASKQFQGLGGYGLLTYSMFVNVSGGSINGAGLYTAGAVPGTDVIKVQDTLGNSATSTITVV